MDEIEKLSAEAAKKICGNYPATPSEAECAAIIKSAIEKAYQAGRALSVEEYDRDYKDFAKLGTSRAAHASEATKDKDGRCIRCGQSPSFCKCTEPHASGNPRCATCNEWILPNHVAVHEGENLVHACCRKPVSPDLNDESDQV